jgi:hypothetical protein
LKNDSILAGARSLQLVCRRLPFFATDDLRTVQEAFQNATPCTFTQSWLTQGEARFAPGTVRMGWNEESLLVFAELMDEDIFTQASSPNEKLWQRGDTFEIFLRPADQSAYLELHVAPNNLRLQLRFANSLEAYESGAGRPFENLVISDAFTSKTWVEFRIKKWFVLAEIPAHSVCECRKPLVGSEWLFSFGRYDYTRGRSGAVISSTSAHTEPDFHRQPEWGRMTFAAI